MGEREYKGYRIVRGYDVLGTLAWLVQVEAGTLSFPTLRAAKDYVDQAATIDVMWERNDLRQAIRTLTDLRSSMTTDTKFVDDGGLDVLDGLVYELNVILAGLETRWP